LAAVALLAGLPEAAELAVHPQTDRRAAARHEAERAQRLSVGEMTFLGTSQSIGELASLAGVMPPPELRDVVLYRGIDAAVHRELLEGRVRPRGAPRRFFEEQDEEGHRSPMGVGILSEGRGVYSVLTDGSFLAVMGRNR
jgi:hypothetical protein